MSQPFTSMEGTLWILPGGPNTEPKHLGCHMLGDVERDRGENELLYCSDASGPNRYRVVGKLKAPPGLASFTIETDVQQVADYLEEVQCTVGIIATQTKRGRKDDVSNWDRAFIFLNTDIVSDGLTGLVGKDENVRSGQSFDCEADDIIRLLPLRVYRQSTAETRGVNAVAFGGDDLCATEAGPAGARCDVLYAVTDGAVAATANVLRYQDGAWAGTAADPFAVAENISALAVFALDRDTTRVLVFRGTTDVANPAECAYSDDSGATWATVNIGSDTGEFVPKARSVCALDRNNIWVGTDSGRIYFSGDGGATWAVQENAVIQAAAWNWVGMLDSNNGFAGGAGDVLAKTTDGGATWSVVAATGGGGDILCGHVLSPQQAWVGTDDGDLYYTLDGGATWRERTFAGAGTGDVKDIVFLNAYVGLMVHDNATPVGAGYFTKDGGYTWERLTTPTNAGLNQALLCTPRLAYIVGEPSGGTAVIYKLTPVQ